MAEEQWWYCLKHSTVESGDKVCKATDRLGPYPTRGDAENALQRVAERNEKWDSEDEY